jgi:putative ABC transport system permease protein
MKRFFRLCLRILPPGFREKHRSEMELVFAEAVRSRPGLLSGLALAAGTIADVLRLRWMLWRAEVRPRSVKRRSSRMESLWLDLKLAIRSLRKRRDYTLLALLTLAFGIGAVTAVFSVLNGVLLRPLPYSASDRIVILWHDLGNGAQSLPALHPLDYFDYRERSERFEDWTLATGRELILSGDAEPELVDVGVVAANFFSFFGADPFLGRSFTAEEEVFGGPKVAILTHRIWSRRFGGDPGVVGRTVRLGGEDHEVVGVLPESFRLLLPPEAFRLRDAEIWTPTQIDRKDLPPRNFTGYTAFGKMNPGVRLEEAQEEMDRLEAQLKSEHAEHQAANLQVRAVLLHGDVVKRARPTLRVLMAAVGLVLLIACGNTAQLLLTRFRTGERELSIRAAMGASRWRLARLVVLEGFLLALGGGLLGILLARIGIEVLPRFATSSLPRLDSVVVDRAVAGLALASAFGAALLFSLVPALSTSRASLSHSLADAGRGSASRRKTHLRSILVVTEVALSVVLLIATGLTIRSFVSLLEVEPGFEAGGLLTLRVSLPPTEFPEQEERSALYDVLEEKILALPGVISVAAVNQLPLTGSGTLQPYAYDEETTKNWESVTADERYVTPGFLPTMGATLIAGRELTRDDVPLGRRRSLIDETLAERAFGGKSAIGRLLRVEPLGHEDPFTEVVGVVRHVRLHDLTRPLLPQFYFPLSWWTSLSLAVRTEGAPETLVSAVTAEVRRLAPGAAIEDVAPMERLVSQARSQARLSLVLMVGFGVFAILLASVGLFGVVSYAVSQRRAELGIRLALGATPAGVRLFVLEGGFRLVAAALVLGLAAAAGLGHLMSGFLYGVRAFDPLTYASVAVLLGLVALAACWVPAQRATRVDPVTVLKSE